MAVAHEMETASGAFVNLLHPDPETIKVADIATALCRINRFGGHADWTVADHSRLAAALAYHLAASRGMPERRAALHALLHDAHEAYIGDVIQPIKAALESESLAIDGVRPHDWLAGRFDQTIRAALEVGEPSLKMQQLVKDADAWALHLEAEAHFPSRGAGWIIALPDEAVDEHGSIQTIKLGMTFYPLVEPHHLRDGEIEASAEVERWGHVTPHDYLEMLVWASV